MVCLAITKGTVANYNKRRTDTKTQADKGKGRNKR